MSIVRYASYLAGGMNVPWYYEFLAESARKWLALAWELRSNGRADPFCLAQARLQLSAARTVRAIRPLPLP